MYVFIHVNLFINYNMLCKPRYTYLNKCICDVEDFDIVRIPGSKTNARIGCMHCLYNKTT